MVGGLLGKCVTFSVWTEPSGLLAFPSGVDSKSTPQRTWLPLGQVHHLVRVVDDDDDSYLLFFLHHLFVVLVAVSPRLGEGGASSGGSLAGLLPRPLLLVLLPLLLLRILRLLLHRPMHLAFGLRLSPWKGPDNGVSFSFRFLALFVAVPTGSGLPGTVLVRGFAFFLCCVFFLALALAATVPVAHMAAAGLGTVAGMALVLFAVAPSPALGTVAGAARFATFFGVPCVGLAFRRGAGLLLLVSW